MEHGTDPVTARFEALRDAVCEAATKGVAERGEAFRAAGTAFVLRFFQVFSSSGWCDA